MEIVDELLKNDCKDSPTSTIGLRVNPVVGGGTISIFNTATKLSKFGLPLMDETRQRLIDLYKKYDWLNGIHFHVGSQGNPMELFVTAGEVRSLNDSTYYKEYYRCCCLEIKKGVY